MHPGSINTPEQIEKICIVNGPNFNKFLPFLEDSFNNLYLKPGNEVQEDNHYLIMPDEVFEYLYQIYGGVDIRRYSVEIFDQMSTKTPSTQKSMPNSPETAGDTSDMKTSATTVSSPDPKLKKEF